MGPGELMYVGQEGQNIWIEAQTPVGTLYLRQDTKGHLYARLMGPKLETEVFDQRLKQMSVECINELARALKDELVIGIHGSYLCREFAEACATKRTRLIHAQQRIIETYLRYPSCDERNPIITREERNSIVALICFTLEKAALSPRGNEQGT